MTTNKPNLILGDCLDAMKSMPDNSVDSIVTDPPYGLSFMGKKWDYDVPGVDIWQECLRVLKPGGHLLAFAGTRTQHRMAVRIEDAGFEIRDIIGWLYGSGFPKSLNVSKAIDKNNGEVGRLHKFTKYMRTTGLTARQINEATGTFMGSHYLADKSQPAIPTCALWTKLRPLCGDVPAWVDELVDRIEADRDRIGQRATTHLSFAPGQDSDRSGTTLDITAPATEAAKQWNGFGTALKPSFEPVTVARKPLIGTVAENVLTHGTGGINIEGCRIGAESVESGRLNRGDCNGYGSKLKGQQNGGISIGRWPANLIHDGSPDVLAIFPETGLSSGGETGETGETGGIGIGGAGKRLGDGSFGQNSGGLGDSGSAARFFYCAKASKRDRDEGMEARNNHATVKPTDLMRYLCRLVTPPGGVVLDPFMGSGTTGKAAILEGMQFIGIEKDPDYFEIAKKRIEYQSKLGYQPTIFSKKEMDNLTSRGAVAWQDVQNTTDWVE